jgi:hypothetical protein
MFDIRAGLLGGGSTRSVRRIIPGWNALRGHTVNPAPDAHDGSLHWFE